MSVCDVSLNCGLEFFPRAICSKRLRHFTWSVRFLIFSDQHVNKMLRCTPEYVVWPHNTSELSFLVVVRVHAFAGVWKWICFAVMEHYVDKRPRCELAVWDVNASCPWLGLGLANSAFTASVGASECTA